MWCVYSINEWMPTGTSTERNLQKLLAPPFDGGTPLLVAEGWRIRRKLLSAMVLLAAARLRGGFLGDAVDRGVTADCRKALTASPVAGSG